jgi:hypothetical protein
MPPEKKIINLFWKLKLKLYIFQQYFTPPPHPWNKVRSKPSWVPSTPLILTRSTILFSKCFQSYGYTKKYADSGNWTNMAGRTTDARLLRLWVQIPLGAWMSVFCEYYVLPQLHVLIDLTNIQIILTNMWMTLTLLFICKLFRAQTARHQNKYGGRVRLFKCNINIAMFNIADARAIFKFLLFNMSLVLNF